jgi:hypothetical protein
MQAKHEPKRDSRGRWLKGETGNPNGRARGFDFRRIIIDTAAKSDVDLPRTIWAIFAAILKAALKGDVHAAKLLLDRLCDTEPDRLHVTQELPGPPIPERGELLDGIRRLSKLGEELLSDDGSERRAGS